ncbi:LysR family transcriptional regulator [Angustibacter peucedani]
MEIELRHLRLVRAVADASSVTRAAAVLGASQPSVTRTLRRIEQSLGGPLFERSHEGVEPTALGKLVVARARAILPAVESLVDDVEAARSAGSAPAQVRLGACTGPAMVGLVQGMEALLPSTQVTFDSETRVEGLLDLAATARVDLAVVGELVGYELAVPPDLDRHPVLTQPVFVMLAEDHPLARHDEVDLADLADARWVLNPLDVDREYDALAAACDAVGFAPQVDHFLAGSPNVEFVRAGRHVGLCYPVARFAGVATRPLVGTPMAVRHLAVTSRRSPLAPFVPRLLRHAVARLEAAGAEVPSYVAWVERHGRLPLTPEGRAARTAPR